MPLIKRNILARTAWLLGAVVTVAFLPACVATAPQIERPAAISNDALLEQGIQFAVEDLLAQALKTPGFQIQPKSALDQLLKTGNNKPVEKSLVVIDNTLEGVAGQQTEGTRLVDRRLLQLLRDRLDSHEVAAVNAENVKSANYLVTGTLTQAEVRNSNSGFKINVSLTDLRSGFVIAQAVARVRSNGVDETPTRFFRESPAVSKDRATDGQIKTAQTRAGAEADGLYLSRLPVAALISDGDKQYENGRCDEALKYYEAAVSRPAGQQLHVLNGIYLCQMQLERMDAAEAAFGRIVALGLATNNLSVKFLFRPGSVEFIGDSKVNAPYAMWLRQIARETAAAKVCMLVVGHTSKTGTEQVNNRLSLQRGATIQRRLDLMAPEISGRIQPVGMGFKENLIGTGTDDLRDALDRRVEFKVRPC
jgi:outer membrane protein OmpA-like peptidoglycan-associated protein